MHWILLRRGLLILILGAVAWGFYNQSVLTHRQFESDSNATLRGLRQSISVAERKIEHIKSLEVAASHARIEIDDLLRELPIDSPMLWFPKRVASYYERQGLPGAATRMISEKDEPQLTIFTRTYWTVQVPVPTGNNGAAKAFSALAELELREPLIQILDASVRPDANESTGRLFVANVSTLTRK